MDSPMHCCWRARWVDCDQFRLRAIGHPVFRRASEEALGLSEAGPGLVAGPFLKSWAGADGWRPQKFPEAAECSTWNILIHSEESPGTRDVPRGLPRIDAVRGKGRLQSQNSR
jgi:hypothetical protein